MEKAEGYVQHIIFRNEENGYTVLTLEAPGEELTVVGSFPSVHEGEYLEAEGQYTMHASYGRQFQMSRYSISVPKNGIALEKYLGSGAIRGIGPALAGRIVKRFGEDTLRIMEEEPERLAEIKGISMRMAQQIGEQVLEKAHMQNALIFLTQYGISLNLGIRIYNRYQDSLYRILQENPYRIAEDIQGVGFRTADEIASRVGIRVDSEFRIRSGILYVLYLAQQQGHLYLPKEILIANCGKLLGVEAESIEKYLTDLAIDRRIVVKQEPSADSAEEILVYTGQSWFLELNTARMLYQLNVSCGKIAPPSEKTLEKIETACGIKLDPLQRKAVVSAAENGVTVLTGGPGTGKTTTINVLLRFFESQGMEIALAAPTGRAAKRMTEATGYEASTIHRLLELTGVIDDSPASAHFERNEDHPLEADVIIIDEMSMVDNYIMHALLNAVVPGTRLVLVGDMNQLPSVGPGSVLKEIIRSEVFPVTELNRIFRQADRKSVV